MIDTFDKHEPVLVHFGDRHSTPAECCGACSDEAAGTWVPVTMCAVTAANQLPQDAPCPNVVHLPPRCGACGRRDRMESWQDPGASGWQCTYMDCQAMNVYGECE